MYIVRFGERDGYFGPFETKNAAYQYITDCDSIGRVISLVKPYALGKIEGERIEAAVTLASENGDG